ncbi:Mov34/MPN/PAD-1 family protein [Stutzerimonas nitrititolerans]|uniref:Mov34/MPN/PAD-1 family protein n=1 Tax=Stutzerimonas nitrititolerans TaxID=2482751 RepID=UPI0035E3DE8A
MQPLALIDPGSGRLVVVSALVIELVARYKQLKAGDPESGGILIGLRRGEHFEITAATMPQVDDKRTRFRFERVERGHAEALKKRWAVSMGAENYLGEWHTHPEDHPSPSSIDVSEWQRAVGLRRAATCQITSRPACSERFSTPV